MLIFFSQQMQFYLTYKILNIKIYIKTLFYSHSYMFLSVRTITREYTECPRRNGQNFGRVFLMLKYTDITQNTYIQSWTVTQIMAREVW